MEYWVIMIGFNRLNVSENKSYVCKKGKKHTKYKNVRDSEFFCNNEKTLKKVLTFLIKYCKIYFVRRNGGIGRRARFRSV